MKIQIRKIIKEDIKDLKNVLGSIDLFPSEYLDEMINDYLDNQDSQDLWFTATLDEAPISIGFCAPEKLTEGTYNLYAIGVKNDWQGKGIGKQMMAYLENELVKINCRILIVETSGSDDLKLTRQFYKNLQFDQEATIRDFWNEGEDKVVFWKKLNQ